MVQGTKPARGERTDSRIGNYLLCKWLAQGGMAELYLARPYDTHGGDDIVVVKKVLPQFAQDLQFTRMFQREARLASALKHPNIVEVHDAGDAAADGCYLVMEYIYGVDLRELLNAVVDAGKVLPLQFALDIAISMASGLNHAHELRGDDGRLLELVHRDVSPSNVMVSFDGRVKILDFGVAKALALTSFTQAGTRKGKLSYMSPEQARAEQIDRRADVFAIGAVLYEMTTMRRMFGGDNELAIMYQLLHRDRTKPSEVVPSYPPELEQIVLKALAMDAEDRFQSASELQQALEVFAARVGLVRDPEALGVYLRDLIPPPLHPVHDPEMSPGLSEPHGEADDDVATAVEAGGSGTIPGRTASRRDEQPTGPGARGATVAAPGPPPSSPAAPVAVTAPYAPLLQPTNRPAPRPVGSSVLAPGLAAFAAVLALGGVLFVAFGPTSSTRETEAAPPAPAPADASAVPAPQDPEPPVAAPADPTPTAPAEPVFNPDAPHDGEPAAPAQPDEPLVEVVVEGDDPAEPAEQPDVTETKPSRKKTRPNKGSRRGDTAKGKSRAGKGKAGKSTKGSKGGKGGPPPPPPPTKKRPPTDTLLPG